MDNSTLLNAALEYASQGCKVFPLNGKKPVFYMGTNFAKASSDPEQIRTWWGGVYADCNIGIATGEDSGFIVLDVDGGSNKFGPESLDELEAANSPLPPTLIQKTGYGKHLLFRMGEDDIRNSASKVAPNLDVRGNGGYIVAAPSIHPDALTPYEWANGKFAVEDIADAPEWLVKLALGSGDRGGPPPPRTPANFYSGGSTSVLAQECEKIRSAPNGKQNSILNSSAFRIGTLIADGAIDRDKAVSALIDAGMDMTSFDTHNPWKQNQISKIVKRGVTDGHVKHEAQGNRYSSVMDRFNQDHALVMVGGKCLVLKEAVEPASGQKGIVLMSPFDFRTFYSDQTIPVGGKSVKAGQAWLDSPSHRKYDGVVFAPDGAPANYYNLWHGFTVEPKAGECGKYLNHIRTVICSGEEMVFEYVLNFLADAVQNPSKRAGVALVLRGDQGVGKGVFVSNFGKLFGPHFKHVSSPHHLVGNFNSPLKDALIVFADEAFWAGDKAAEGKLKALITEETNIIEMKGKDAFAVKNFVRLIVASNNEWIVPAGPNERRFFVLDVSERKRQDSSYFGAIAEEMDNGGREALLDFLMKRDITGVNIRKFPKTSALNDQKMQSLGAKDKWMMDVLMAGTFSYTGGEYGDYAPLTDPVQKSDVMNSLTKSCQLTNQKNHSNVSEVGQYLKRVFPRLETKRRSLHGDRKYCYIFPKLSECRNNFAKHVGFTPPWPD